MTRAKCMRACVEPAGVTHVDGRCDPGSPFYLVFEEILEEAEESRVDLESVDFPVGRTGVVGPGEHPVLLVRIPPVHPGVDEHAPWRRAHVARSAHGG